MFNGLQTLVKHKVSQDRNRYVDDKYDLDLTYITPKVIAMGLPSEGFNSLFRNNIDDVARFFKEKHFSYFMLYNLTSEHTYDISKFDNQVLSFGFPDHHNPPIEHLMMIIKSVAGWLEADEKNVVAIHCKAGKGRTGTVICSYLLYKGICNTPEEALLFFKKMRSNGDNPKGGSVDEPSQVRYINYYYQIIQKKVEVKQNLLNLKKICVNNVPYMFLQNGSKIVIEVFQFKKTELNTYTKNVKRTIVHNPEEVFTLGENSYLILFNVDLDVEGDYIIDCRVDWNYSTQLMFRYSFHSAFIDGLIQAPKGLLDEAFKNNDIPKNFSVDFLFGEDKDTQVDYSYLYNK
eukprot:gene5746-9567_t